MKLIAEPWDVGEGGYQVGNFPALWSEWNGKYRDETRDFWRGAEHTVAEFGYRFTGSSDLYQPNGRTPSASINFVTAHDGFTLHDLVSYDDKHNDANGEDNRDGTDDNRSWNCGAEGPTDDEQVNALRRRQRRNLLTTLMLSQGVPMLLGGDEMGRTQGGNNNAYCQDNEVSWYDWSAVDHDLLDFTRRLVSLRRAHRVFRRRRFFQGQPIMGEHIDDIGWFTPKGVPMSDDDWQTGSNRSIGVFLNGEALPGQGPRGERLADDSFFVAFNASDGDEEFHLPDETYGTAWMRGARHRARRRRTSAFPRHARTGLHRRRTGAGRPPGRRCCCSGSRTEPDRPGHGHPRAGDLPGAADAHLRPRPRRGDRARTSPGSASATSTPRPSPRPRPAAPTATTSPTRAGCAPSSGASRPCAGCGRRSTAVGHGPRRRPGAQPHGHPRPLEPVVAGRAPQRPGAARSPTTSTSTGSRPTRARTGKVVLPFLDRPFDRRRARRRPAGRAGHRPPRPRRGPPRRPVARLGGVARPARPRPRRLHRAGRRRARRPQPLARGAGAVPRRPALAGRALARGTAGCSTGAASSTSPTWPRSASSARRSSTTSTRCCAPGSPTTSAAGSCRASASTTSTAWSTRRATSSGSAPWSVPTGCWWWRRSWPPTSSCPRRGRSTAPPATTSWPDSTRPSPTPWAPRSCADGSPPSPGSTTTVARARAALPAPGGRAAPRPRGRPGGPGAGRRPRRPRPGPRPTPPQAVVTGLAVELGVYRTYARPGDAPVDDADHAELDGRPTALRDHRPDLDPGLVEATRALLAHEGGGGPGRDTFAARFAQLSAPLAAKAVEDTAFYRDPSLPWLTEVGGDPGRAGVATDEVHAAFAALAVSWPGTFVPLTTHDTKRSGDVRARLSRLAAEPERTVEAFTAWRRLAERPPLPRRPRARPSSGCCGPPSSAPGPSTPTAWRAFATKAMREAKDRTSWIDPDPAYEDAVAPLRPRRDGRSGHRRRRSTRSSAPCSSRAGRRRWPSSPSPAPRPASPTSTRATRSGTSPSSTPTTDARSTPTTSPSCSTGRPTPASTWPRCGPATAADPDDDGLVKMATWHRLLRLRAAPPARLHRTPRPRSRSTATTGRACWPSARGDRRRRGRPGAARRPRDRTGRAPAGAVAGRAHRRPARGRPHRARRRCSTGSRWRSWSGPDGI